MKYVFLSLMMLCAYMSGLMLGSHHYGLAALNFACVIMNYFSYKRAKDME